jgi:hypothetical protein
MPVNTKNLIAYSPPEGGRGPLWGGGSKMFEDDEPPFTIRVIKGGRRKNRCIRKLGVILRRIK